MKRHIAILCLLSILAAGCVTKDDIVSMDDRIFRVEQRQKEMENRLSNVSEVEQQFESKLAKAKDQGQEELQPLRSQLAELRVMNTRLREDLQELTGRVEENEYHLRKRTEGKQQAGERLENRVAQAEAAIAENTDRIRQLEQYLDLERKQETQSRKEKEQKKASAQEPTEDELYKSGKEAFDKEQFAEARDVFKELLKRFPQSTRADNAQFWIAETYYREKWYEKAILEYQKVIEQYPKGNKVPAAMLKQGFAFDQLGDSANARLVLKELIREHPDSNEAKIAEDKLQKLG